jgi:mannosyl-oligosaccharide alpha-1,2-mannosidase
MRMRRVDMVKHKMDHLSCFIPAMLALGAHAGAVTGEKAEKYLQVAEELTHTCWQMYHQMPTGEYICTSAPVVCERIA